MLENSAGSESSTPDHGRGRLGLTTAAELLPEALKDAGSGWSIGTFGAIAEFVRDANEPVARHRNGIFDQLITERGGICIGMKPGVTPIAYDLLSSDGQTWSHALTFCLPRPTGATVGTVRSLGPDLDALRPEYSAELLFDLGVGIGLVDLCIRTDDPVLIAELSALEGASLFSPTAEKARALLVQISPHRVARSPLGRIEVYAPIPGRDGRSPDGPHTHLLPKLLSAGRTHGANVPIPDGLQPVLTLHPRSPWRDAAGTRTPFDSHLDEEFSTLLDRYALREDKLTRGAVEGAVLDGVDPATYRWPDTRRGRAQARITLRRLAQRWGSDRVVAWRRLYDHAGAPSEDDPMQMSHVRPAGQ